MVSEEEFADGAVHSLFSELSADVKRFFEISFATCCPSVSNFQRNAAEKAKEYEQKRVEAFYIDCLPDHDGTFPDVSIGFKDITLQVFGVAPIYQGNRLDVRRLETILDRGIFLKK